MSIADKWEKRTARKEIDGKKIEILEKISDWTYSSPYKGSLRLPQQFPFADEFSDKNGETAKILGSVRKSAGKAPFEVSNTDESLPLHRLGQNNPIVWNGEIFLFEDDLDDFGYSAGKFKFRVMEDCFYGIVRSYVRVDNVAIRLLETRIFHDFKTTHILRQFTVKEGSYKALRKLGVQLDSSFNMNPLQADIIGGRYMREPIFLLKDKITLNDIGELKKEDV